MPADNSHEISCLIYYSWKSSKIGTCRLLQIIGGALWVNKDQGAYGNSVFDCKLSTFFCGTMFQSCLSILSHDCWGVQLARGRVVDLRSMGHLTRGHLLCPWASHFIIYLVETSEHGWKNVDRDVRQQLKTNKQTYHQLKLLSCQPRVTVTSCFVYKVIRDF